MSLVKRDALRSVTLVDAFGLSSPKALPHGCVVGVGVKYSDRDFHLLVDDSDGFGQIRIIGDSDQLIAICMCPYAALQMKLLPAGIEKHETADL
jgi:hypothetical protein